MNAKLNMVSQHGAAQRLKLLAALVESGVIALDGFTVDATLLDGGGTFTFSGVVSDE